MHGGAFLPLTERTYLSAMNKWKDGERERERVTSSRSNHT